MWEIKSLKADGSFRIIKMYACDFSIMVQQFSYNYPEDIIISHKLITK